MRECDASVWKQRENERERERGRKREDERGRVCEREGDGVLELAC